MGEPGEPAQPSSSALRRGQAWPAWATLLHGRLLLRLLPPSDVRASGDNPPPPTYLCQSACRGRGRRGPDPAGVCGVPYLSSCRLYLLYPGTPSLSALVVGWRTNAMVATRPHSLMFFTFLIIFLVSWKSEKLTK